MKQPEGFVADGQDLVCRFRKSICGFKQLSRCWNQTPDVQLKLMGFKQSTSDPCINTSATESDGLFILNVSVQDKQTTGTLDCSQMYPHAHERNI